MKPHASALLALLLVSGGLGVRSSAESPPLTPRHRSRPGQFVVPPPPASSTPLSPPAPAHDPQRRRLTPELLLVSCERIKQRLLQELGAPDEYRGKIQVAIRPQLTDEAPLEVSAKFYADGWQYHLDVPEEVQEIQLVRALVQALLMEMANRQSVGHVAEIPLWLAEGLTHILLADAYTELVLQPRTATSISGLRRAPFFEVHRRLNTHAPLTFAELSQPTPAHLSGATWDVYGSCAQLLVHELSSLPDGRTSLQAMLRQAPKNLNWQTTFLQTFHAHFQTLLDVEKWWAVAVANFTGRSDWQEWRPEIALQKLAAALRVTAQVPAGKTTASAAGEFPPQRVIRELDFARQKILLRALISQVQATRLRMPGELAGLTDDYVTTLDGYLQNRAQAGYGPQRKNQAVGSAKLAGQQALQRLDALDARRTGLQARLTTTAPP